MKLQGKLKRSDQLMVTRKAKWVRMHCVDKEKKMADEHKICLNFA